MTDDVERGKFIVIEGADGVGTTTQARLIGEEWAKWYGEPHVTHNPSMGAIGRQIRECLRDEDVSHDALALLFAADRLF